MIRTPNRITLTVTIAALGLMAFAAPAGAALQAQVTDPDPADPFNGFVLTISEESAGSDHLSATRTGSGDDMVYTFQAPTGITDLPTADGPDGQMGQACTANAMGDLVCNIPVGSITLIKVRTGFGPDLVDFAGLINSSGTPLSFELHDGAGNDTVFGPNVRTTWQSSAGDDEWHGGTRSDVYLMGPVADGDDSIQDPSSVGINYNTLSYRQRTDAVFVRLADVSDFAQIGAEVDTFTALFGNVETGSGNDNIRLDDGGLQVDSGAGNDLLVGGDGQDELYGGTGDDRVYGGGNRDEVSGGPDNGSFESGSDVLHGGNGNDVIFSVTEERDGADDIFGDAGFDTMSYVDRLDGGVTVSLDNVANDGRTGAGEGDNVHTSVEAINASRWADRIVGSSLANRIGSGPGSDIVFAGAGDDRVYGGYPDFEFGAPFTDGIDKFWGEEGDDVLRVRDSAGGDAIDGGPGDDIGVRDDGDAVSFVETVF